MISLIILTFFSLILFIFNFFFYKYNIFKVVDRLQKLTYTHLILINISVKIYPISMVKVGKIYIHVRGKITSGNQISVYI